MHQHRLNSRAASTAADAVCRLLDGGYLRIFAGEQPLSADSAINGQPLLAQLLFAEQAFRPAVGGEAHANPLEREWRAKASGRATWFRAFAADGTPVLDGSVGESNSNLILDDTDIQADAEVSVTAFTYKQAVLG